MSGVELRPPTVADGAAMWRLVRDAGVLDQNSPYLYLLLADHFAETCAVAVASGEVVGLVTGYRRPDRIDTWFLWQIGVAASARGEGLATRLAMHVLARPALADVRWLETTVSPSNTASRALFAGLARRLDCALDLSEGFGPDLFPVDHEAEALLRLGPFHRSTP